MNNIEMITMIDLTEDMCKMIRICDRLTVDNKPIVTQI